MKHLFQTIFILPFTFFCMVGCKKDIGTFLQGKNNNNTPNFYLAGQSNGKPCLWINGTKNILSNSNGNANQILINGNDIYVTGYYELPNTNLNPGGFMPMQCVYWKNGVENKVGKIIYGQGGFQTTISIVNNDIYYANGQAWENGSQLNFNLANMGFVQQTTSYGSNIYFVGTDSSGKAVYWENGLEHDIISNETKSIVAYSLAVSSNNVYIGGEDSNQIGTVWINGIPENLHFSIPGSYAVFVSSLFANGTDIYAVAELEVPTSMANGSYSYFNNIPAYWKNGIENDLPLNGDSYGNASTVFVNGSDIYVCGNIGSGAVYWENGIETKLGSDYGSVSSILIK
ncbi:MAG TPA: hypothetical protein VIJ75_12855 [Hanamia sp.]